MKIKLLFAAMLLCLISCSDDDSSAPVNEIQKDILTISAVTYDDDGDQVGNYIINCENNKPVSRKIFDYSGSLVLRYEYVYTPTGLLSAYSVYYGTVKRQDAMLTYDASGRLTEILYKNYNEVNETWQTKTFTYNADNTITATWNNESGNTSVDMYYLNASGQIYNITANGDNVGMAVYEGNDIISLTGYNGITTFTYKDRPEVKGDFLNINKNQVGSYTNAILWYGFSSISEGIDRYKKDIQMGAETYAEYTYELSEDGYPVKRTMFIGPGFGTEVITITYQ